MRIHAASASAPVSATLAAIIAASGHTLSDAATAELVLVDTIHPLPDAAYACEQLLLGSAALPCPFSPQQLRRLLVARRSHLHVMLGAGWQLECEARTLTHPTSPATPLTEKECALLHALAAARPHALAREQLLAEIWGITHAIDTHTLETHIYRLRQKLEALEPMPCDIVTEDGHYRLICKE